MMLSSMPCILACFYSCCRIHQIRDRTQALCMQVIYVLYHLNHIFDSAILSISSTSIIQVIYLLNVYLSDKLCKSPKVEIYKKLIEPWHIGEIFFSLLQPSLPLVFSLEDEQRRSSCPIILILTSIYICPYKIFPFGLKQ